MTRLTISALGSAGDGVAVLNGRPVYVPLTAPGDDIEADMSANRAVLKRIAQPSPHRAQPVCSHFEACGGCALQHLSDAFVADWKRDLIVRALAAQGLETTLTRTITVPAGTRRRATFSARRTTGGLVFGFQGRGAHEVVDLTECPVAAPEIVNALPALRDLAELAAPSKRMIQVAATVSLAGLDVAISDAKELDMAGSIAVADLAEKFDFARLSWNGDVVALRRPPGQKFGRAVAVPPPGVFLQVAPAAQTALVALIKRAVGPAARSVADLFCGCGTFALPLAETADVDAFESDPAMIAALDTAWRRTGGLKTVRAQTRDLFRRPVLAQELNAFDAVVFDPPRAGAEAQCREIAASTVSRVAAASCNPVTFARDAKILTDQGFTLEWAAPVDQFRWSPHVELAALFTR